MNPPEDAAQSRARSGTALGQAIAFAESHEIGWARDPVADPLNWGIHHGDRPPWNKLLGPVHGRGPVSGVVMLRGREVASFGEPDRADLTFSVAKTYLALLAGVAHDRGLLPDVDEPVLARVRGIGFEAPRNQSVTWRHLLQQTSEWQGRCFGIPDQVDHFRQLSFAPIVPESHGRAKGERRRLQPPGSYWEYNDVRINQLSLALMHLFGAALPEVFATAIMRPLGASNNWRWAGYHNSWVDVRGRKLQSVPGGTHWGGGVSISARDQALIGQMMLDGGRGIVSAAWVDAMRAPCSIAPWYGFLQWLNSTGTVFPSLPRDVYAAFGAGGAVVCLAPSQQAVIVARWLAPEHIDPFIAKVLAAL